MNITEIRMKSNGLGRMAIGLVFCWLVGCQPQAEPKPNVVVILADDAGYADFGFMGSSLPTPNIDQLANSGVVFTDAHTTASVCSPSRAGLLTGRYQQRFGFEANIPPPDQGMDPEEKTIGDAMQQAGYITGYIGKWHLGSSDPYHPNKRGFDEFWGFLGGSRSYFFEPEGSDRPGQSREILHNDSHVDFVGYLTDRFSDQAINFIEMYREESFFLFLSYNAVHTPMHAREEDLAQFEGDPRAKLSAMTMAMDRGIGKLMDKLKAYELYDNTLIFFLNDNGGATNNQSSNHPLKGFKGNKFEGGHRIPLILSWPAQLPKGRIYEGLTSSMDIFATSMAAAGLINPPGKPLDGVNLIPHITGEIQSEPHDRLFWRKEKMAAVREGNLKLIRLDGYGYRLYDLQMDHGETNDMADSLPEKLAGMQQALETWERDLIAPLWAESEAWQQVTYEIHRSLMENREVTVWSPADLPKMKTD
jgi:arylsulfatase A-like enzyme